LAIPTEPAPQLERRLQHNHKWSRYFIATFQGRFTDVRAPKEAFIGHNWRRRNDRVSTCHAGSTEERKLERQKPFLSRRRYPLEASS
jgi:hypothetical protein